MARCSNHHQFDIEQALLDQTGWKRRQRTHNTKTRSPIQNRLHRATERLDIETQRRRRKLDTKFSRRLGDHLYRQKHVEDSRQLGLESASNPLCPRLHGVDAGDHRTRIRQQDNTFLRQPGITPRTIEQHDAKLSLQTQNRFAHR